MINLFICFAWVIFRYTWNGENITILGQIFSHLNFHGYDRYVERQIYSTWKQSDPCQFWNKLGSTCFLKFSPRNLFLRWLPAIVNRNPFLIENVLPCFVCSKKGVLETSFFQREISHSWESEEIACDYV